jgi:pimeloyl-ACP methyl ester carboxylesterase
MKYKTVKVFADSLTRFGIIVCLGLVHLTIAAEPNYYEALSHAPDLSAGNDVKLSIYRPQGKLVYGKYLYKAPAKGLVLVKPPHGTETRWTDEFDIAWTKIGNKGPLVLFLHGVPTNRRQWQDIQGHVSRFAETIAIDMLGMGESSKPRMYGGKDVTSPNSRWRWHHDIDYIDKLMNHYYPGRKFIFVADDWGSGIASHYAGKFGASRLDALVQLDAIAFDGYPVNEIQAIGRASLIPNTPEGDQQFAVAMGAFDQTLVQITKPWFTTPRSIISTNYAASHFLTLMSIIIVTRMAKVLAKLRSRPVCV